MKYSSKIIPAAAGLLLCLTVYGQEVKKTSVDVVLFRAIPFSLTDVRLLEGPFLHACDLDKNTILSYDPDRLLAKFYSEAGLKPKADHYMGWENETLAGHTLGHYLSACSMMYQSTGDTKFLERVNYIVDELKVIQDANKNGYLGAFPKGQKIFEEEVTRGNIRAKGFDLNGIWSPFYTIHKILAGLRDAYELCGNSTALIVEQKFADWISDIVTPLDDQKVQLMLRCEHGGIAETLADLYSDTKNEKYLRLANTFYHKAFLDSLKTGNDILAGKHCNTNIPKLIALSRIYELTGDNSDRRAAEFFWNTVVRHHSYVTGGNGNEEYFGPADKLSKRLGENTTETCNVYNMLKLSEHLFEWNAGADIADFYERALFNHILASQNPENGNVTYNLSLKMGGFKYFQDPGDFTCCIGSGMENHSKYGKNIYYHSNKELFIFQYIASDVTWKEKGISVLQETKYPEEQGTLLKFRCKKPVKLTVQIRYPHWAANGIEITVNNKPLKISSLPGSFVPVTGMWKSGDEIKVKIPFSLRTETMPDDSNRVAFLYGPLVLAGDLGPLSDTIKKESNYVPVLAHKKQLDDWIKEEPGKVATFVTVNSGQPRDIELKPFYKIYNRRYSVYWDIIKP